jgi:hypothetical protein
MPMSTHDLRDLLVEKSTGVLHLGGTRMALLDVEAVFESQSMFNLDKYIPAAGCTNKQIIHQLFSF